MRDNDDKKPVNFFFQVPKETADVFYRLAAAHFGMTKGAKRQIF